MKGLVKKLLVSVTVLATLGGGCSAFALAKADGAEN